MSDTAPPTVRVPGTLDSALASDVLTALGVDSLAPFLARRRWFGGKGRRVTSAAIRDVVPLAWASYRAAAARVEVESDDGATAHYQILLATRAEDEGPRPDTVLAPVESDQGRGFLFDATEDPVFRALLGTTFELGAVFAANHHARWIVEPVAGEDACAIPEGRTHVVAGEQSNTSIIYDDHAILKLYRRLEAGEQPDVEIARFLTTRTNFRGTPPLLGVITFEWGGSTSVAGMLQRFVPGAEDAWAYALATARESMRAASESPTSAFHDDAERLGRVTRALHEALATDDALPDFAPEPVTADDVERWAGDVRGTMAHALELLASRVDAGVFDRRSAAAARALLGRRDALDDRVTEMVSAIGDDAGLRIRIHGDYHLGQVLRAPNGHFAIIDFEGEPTRSLAERRAKYSPLRDVAGMMRSFAYAAAMAAKERAGSDVDPDAEIRAAHWERDARSAFLDGYLHAGKASAEAPTLLPHTRDDVQALLALFETEKVFYELAYELNNRPEWAWVPLRGVAKLL